MITNLGNNGKVFVTTTAIYEKGEIADIPNISKVQVNQFHLAFNHPIATTPTVGSAELRELRVKLILEEALEFAAACGFEVIASTGSEQSKVASIYLVSIGHPDLVEMADALGDLDYVVQGANLAFGIPSEEVMAEIHASNMSKLGEDGRPIYREDGKVLKGPNYFKPDLAKLLIF